MARSAFRKPLWRQPALIAAVSFFSTLGDIWFWFVLEIGFYKNPERGAPPDWVPVLQILLLTGPVFYVFSLCLWLYANGANVPVASSIRKWAFWAGLMPLFVLTPILIYILVGIVAALFNWGPVGWL